MADGRGMLDTVQLAALVDAIAVIEERFRAVNGREDDPGFVMDVEFKIDAHGELVVEQARPWVE